MSERELPNKACSSILMAEARRATPATLRCSPDLVWQRTGVEGPKCARSTMDSKDSNRSSLNAKVGEPNLPGPWKESKKPKLLKSHVGVDDSERPAPKADGFEPE